MTGDLGLRLHAVACGGTLAAGMSVCKRPVCGHYRALHVMGRCLAGAHGEEPCECLGWSP
jgi:hypothetical protein